MIVSSPLKVAKLSTDLEKVQKKYGNVFTIPAYFGYILRAFSVLEGIGLASDPNYSIANECYPFVARRLLTDPSPATRAALEQLLYVGTTALYLKLYSDFKIRRLCKYGAQFLFSTPVSQVRRRGPGGGSECRARADARGGVRVILHASAVRHGTCAGAAGSGRRGSAARGARGSPPRTRTRRGAAAGHPSA